MSKAINDYEFEGFSTRASFNRSLGHFRAVNEVVDGLENKSNLAEVLQELLLNKSIEVHQILPIVQALLVDKLKYRFRSYNLNVTLTDLSSFGSELSQWNAVDLVVVYHHPESGVMVINPKDTEQWAPLEQLKKFELLTLYVGAFDKTPSLLSDKKFIASAEAAFKLFDTLLQGKKGKASATLTEGTFKFKPMKKAPAPKAATKAPAKKGRVAKSAAPVAAQTVVIPTGVPAVRASAPSPTAAPKPAMAAAGRMVQSPKVGVPVTNELFHNGNVEAWKRIIDSYKTKYPNNKVVVYYDGEIIHDINALFKWGKVKHGTAILFSIAAPTQEEIKDISKLRKYLQEGASSRFEQFLRSPVGKILELF